MTESKTWSEELDGLLEHLCDEQLSEDQRVRLNSILRLQPDARWRYLTYLDLHSALSWEGIGSSTSTAAAITSSESAMAEGPIFQGSIEPRLGATCYSDGPHFCCSVQEDVPGGSHECRPQGASRYPYCPYYRGRCDGVTSGRPRPSVENTSKPCYAKNLQPRAHDCGPSYGQHRSQMGN